MTPDWFLGDWYGYVTNQSGHFFLGMALSALLTALLPTRWALALLAVGYGIHEAQDLWRGGYLLDGIEDCLFMAAGAGFVLTGRRGMLAIVSVALAIGAGARRK